VPQKLILIAVLALAAQAASAQTVWRCGSSYSEKPCAGGTEVSALDKRTPAEARQSASVAQADMKLADKMEKERLAREKDAPKALVIGPKDAPKPAAEQKAGKKPEQFVASSGKPKAKPKAPAKAKKTAT
jgi:hypothetical protein